MKKLFILVIAFVLASCSSSPNAKWDVATASKSCFDAATKGKYDLTDVQIKRVRTICDCVGEKMVATFKTEQEANDKMLDAAAFTNECRDAFDQGQLKK